VTTETLYAKLQSNHYHRHTNTVFLQARCPSCCPTNIVEVKDKNAYEHIAHRKKDVELGPFVIQWAGGLLPLAVGYITYGRLPHIASELQVSAGMVWYSRV